TPQRLTNPSRPHHRTQTPPTVFREISRKHHGGSENAERSKRREQLTPRSVPPLSDFPLPTPHLAQSLPITPRASCPSRGVAVDFSFARRGLFQGVAAAGGALAAARAGAGPMEHSRAAQHPGWVFGRMTGAEALTEALITEGTSCIYGIPGAQE